MSGGKYINRNHVEYVPTNLIHAMSLPYCFTINVVSIFSLSPEYKRIRDECPVFLLTDISVSGTVSIVRFKNLKPVLNTILNLRRVFRNHWNKRVIIHLQNKYNIAIVDSRLTY